MREKEYVKGLLRALQQKGTIELSDSIIVVAAHFAEDELLRELGFTNVILTNIQPLEGKLSYPFRVQNAMRLEYDDNAFKLGIVLNSLHHMSKPHLALTELYRVAAKGVLGLEANDSLFMRLLVRFGLTTDYELSIDGTDNPNYIYRWTEREIEKTINSFQPHSFTKIRYFYSFHLPMSGFSRVLGIIFYPLLVLLRFAKQTNTFGFFVQKRKAF
jgi:hypothetical protein